VWWCGAFGSRIRGGVTSVAPFLQNGDFGNLPCPNHSLVRNLQKRDFAGTTTEDYCRVGGESSGTEL
jgi:hypothetical protein